MNESYNVPNEDARKFVYPPLDLHGESALDLATHFSPECLEVIPSAELSEADQEVLDTLPKVGVPELALELRLDYGEIQRAVAFHNNGLDEIQNLKVDFRKASQEWNDEVIQRYEEAQEHMERDLAQPLQDRRSLHQAYLLRKFAARDAEGMRGVPNTKTTPAPTLAEVARERRVVTRDAKQLVHPVWQLLGALVVGGYYGLSIAARNEWVRFDSLGRNPWVVATALAGGAMVFSIMKWSVELGYGNAGEGWYFRRPYGWTVLLASLGLVFFVAIDVGITNGGIALATYNGVFRDTAAPDTSLANWAISFAVGASYLVLAARLGWANGVHCALLQDFAGGFDQHHRLTEERIAAEIHRHENTEEAKLARSHGNAAADLAEELQLLDGRIDAIQGAHFDRLAQILSQAKNPDPRQNPELMAFEIAAYKRHITSYLTVLRLSLKFRVKMRAAAKVAKQLALPGPAHSGGCQIRRVGTLRRFFDWIGRLLGSAGRVA